MGHTIEAEVSAIEAGRRRTVHRVTVVEGVRQVGTERCNLDDAHFHPTPITPEQEALALSEGRRCHWCYPEAV